MAWAYIGFVLYASLLPFDFDWAIGRDHLANAGRVLRMNAAESGRSDIIANVLLYVPLGATVCLAMRRRRRWRWPAGMAAGFLAGAITSGIAEFGQMFSASRTGSLADVLTNTIGVSVGCALAPLILMMQRLLRRRRRRVQSTQPLWHLAGLAGVAVLLCGMVPFDVRADLGQVRDGLRAVEVRPFASLTRPAGTTRPAGPGAADFWVDFAGDAGAFVLVAGALALAATAEAQIGPVAGAAMAIWLGVGIGLVREVSQVFIASRVCDVTDMIAAAAGSVVGAILGAALGRRAASRRWRWDGSGRLLGVAVLSLILAADVAYLAGQGLGPFQFRVPAGSGHLVASVEWVPFRSYTANLTPALVGDFVLKATRYAVFGILLSMALPAPGGRRFARQAIVVTFAAVFVSATIEFLQLFVVSRFSDVSDVLIAAMGALAGVTGVQWYADSVRDARRHMQREAASAPTLGPHPGVRGLRTR